MKPLRVRFAEVCASLDIESYGYFETLDELYRGRLRCYHNWDHIESVLDRIDALEGEVSHSTLNVDLVRFAAFYHDAIYVSGFAANEAMSAKLALAHLETQGSYMSGSAAYSVNEWIRDTKSHKPYDLGGKLLCDADLYELGTPHYDRNGLNVRREFAAFDDRQWRGGRIKFLESYIAREALFSLPGQESLEATAKANMRRELKALRAE